MEKTVNAGVGFPPRLVNTPVPTPLAVASSLKANPQTITVGTSALSTKVLERTVGPSPVPWRIVWISATTEQTWVLNTIYAGNCAVASVPQRALRIGRRVSTLPSMNERQMRQTGNNRTEYLLEVVQAWNKKLTAGRDSCLSDLEQT